MPSVPKDASRNRAAGLTNKLRNYNCPTDYITRRLSLQLGTLIIATLGTFKKRYINRHDLSRSISGNEPFAWILKAFFIECGFPRP